MAVCKEPLQMTCELYQIVTEHVELSRKIPRKQSKIFGIPLLLHVYDVTVFTISLT